VRGRALAEWWQAPPPLCQCVRNRRPVANRTRSRARESPARPSCASSRGRPPVDPAPTPGADDDQTSRARLDRGEIHEPAPVAGARLGRSEGRDSTDDPAERDRSGLNPGVLPEASRTYAKDETQVCRSAAFGHPLRCVRAGARFAVARAVAGREWPLHNAANTAKPRGPSRSQMTPAKRPARIEH
jgi:hypothetical protein